ncbi:MAG: hypothetical protein IKV28_03440 [Bacteroidales bacterium]|nr:hypothetical protein [Bacteroidales bacterium]
MLFRDIRGNEPLKKRLAAMCDQNHAGHALLFSESGEYGAVALAIALAQYLSCTHPNGQDACGTCPNCLKFNKLIHPDLHFIFPTNSTGKSSSRPLSESFLGAWRSLVLSNPYFSEETLGKALGLDEKTGTIAVQEAKEVLAKMSVRAYEGGNKYTLIWLPERMTAEAANKLLKIIEEPYPNTYFFLITHAPERVISTILSRCLRIEVAPIEDLSAEQEETEWQEPALQLLSYAAQSNLLGLLQTGEKLWELGREKQKHFCLYLERCLRDILWIREELSPRSTLTDSAKNTLQTLAQKFSNNGLESAFTATDQARNLIESNVNAKSVFAVLCNSLYNAVNL